MTKQEYYNRFKRFQQSREKKYAPKFKEVIINQNKAFLETYKQTGNESTALMSVNIIELAPLLQELYIDAATTYGAKIASDLKKESKARIPMGFSERMRQLMIQYYYSDILNDANEIINTTKEDIQKVLVEAVSNGYSIDWIEEQIMNSGIPQYRSRMIARTESVTAANKGAMVAAKESGLLVKKEWLATMDNRTRKDHLFVDGTQIGVDDWFNVGGATMRQPGDRTQQNGLPVPAKEVVNCRCTILIIPQRDRSGRVIAT